MSCQTGFFDDQVSRDHTAKNEEAKGIIRFQLLHNSLKQKPPDKHLLWLLELKTLFSRQLPQMPVDYITRIVFDPFVCLFVCSSIFNYYYYAFFVSVQEAPLPVTDQRDQGYWWNMFQNILTAALCRDSVLCCGL